MRPKIEKALNRLNSILPLKERQDACGEEIKGLHREILRSFIDLGRILTREEMGKYIGNLEDAVRVLKEKDMVVFSDDGEPVGAYPFTMEEREHVVRVGDHQVYAMCALDALSVSPMFGVKSKVSSRCRVTGIPITIEQSPEKIENLEETGDIHFGIMWGAADADSCCADSLCLEMMFLKDKEVARQWLANDPSVREVFALQDAVEFGGRFFAPLASG